MKQAFGDTLASGSAADYRIAFVNDVKVFHHYEFPRLTDRVWFNDDFDALPLELLDCGRQLLNIEG
jgi:hypothetical protein